MTATTPDLLESSILARVIRGSNDTLSPGVANELLQWGFDEADRIRMRELAAKARDGSLSADEREEADEYEQVSSFLGLVKSKARRALKTPVN